MTWFWNLSTSVLKNKNGAVLKKRHLDGIVQHLGVFNLLGAVRSHGRKRQNTRAALLPPDLGDMLTGQEMRLGLRLHGSPPTEFQVVNFGTKNSSNPSQSKKFFFKPYIPNMSLRRPRADANTPATHGANMALRPEDLVLSNRNQLDSNRALVRCGTNGRNTPFTENVLGFSWSNFSDGLSRFLQSSFWVGSLRQHH